MTDHQFVQVLLLAWILIFGLMLARVFPRELPNNPEVVILVFGIALAALTAAAVTLVLVALPLRIATNLSVKRYRHSRRVETVTLAGAFLVVVAYVAEVMRERSALVPPTGVDTLQEFSATMAPPSELRAVHSKGSRFIAWTGDLLGPFDVPSGASCYLFDATGKLADWQVETGDGGPVDNLLRAAVEQRPITLAEALESVSNPQLESQSHAKE